MGRPRRVKSLKSKSKDGAKDPGMSVGKIGKKQRRKKHGNARANMLKIMKTAELGQDLSKENPETETETPSNRRTRKMTEKIENYYIDPEKLKIHSRGDGVDLSKIKNITAKTKLQNKEQKIQYSTEQAARTDILLTEESGYLEADDYEETTEFTQKQIVAAVDITSATKHFELKLEFGPYRMNYTNNGRHLLLGGKRGHVAALDWVTKKLLCEINVMEAVHDLKWLHVETMFATAQKEWVYIYDNQGIELHCIRHLHRILHMEFLPYHFLLATASESGHLAWLDVSMGKLVSKYHGRMGRIPHMTQNPYNATLVLGHPTGVVSLWSPMVKDPLAKLLCQKTAIQALAVDPTGRYLATSAIDRSLNVWDLRQMKPLQSYRTRGVPTSLSLSHRGCLATGTGQVVEVYRDCILSPADGPYLTFRGNMGSVRQLQFCPFEDVLGVGQEQGFCSLLVPGCGEPNFDSYENNPFRTKSQRREGEVKALLEKIQPELISLDPLTIAEVDVPTLHDKLEAQKTLLTMRPPKINYEPRRKNKKGGGVQAAKTKKILQEEARKEFAKLSKKNKNTLLVPEEQGSTAPATKPSVLDRFKSKPKKSTASTSV